MLRFRHILKPIHTHALMKISTPQPPIYSSAWSNCSFTKLMRKWTKIKKSFSCCITWRQEATFLFLLWAIISQLQHNTAPSGVELPFGVLNAASEAWCVSGRGIIPPAISLVFIFIAKISWHIAWVMLQEDHSLQIAPQDHIAIIQNMRCFLFQLHHNRFNYSCVSFLHQALSPVFCLGEDVSSLSGL